MLHDLAVLDTGDLDPVHLDLLTSRRDLRAVRRDKRSGVRTANRELAEVCALDVALAVQPGAFFDQVSSRAMCKASLSARGSHCQLEQGRPTKVRRG